MSDASAGMSGKRAFPVVHGPVVLYGDHPSSMTMNGRFPPEGEYEAMRSVSERMASAELLP